MMKRGSVPCFSYAYLSWDGKAYIQFIRSVPVGYFAQGPKLFFI